VAYLVDTSSLIHLLRDRTGVLGPRYDSLVGNDPVVLSRVTEFKILKGAKDARELDQQRQVLAGQSIVPFKEDYWAEAGHIVFDLRRAGLTLKNPVDALMAAVAHDHNLTIPHDDMDFELIQRVRALTLIRFRPEST
jgi:predicted nucleic acid-binding protein